MPYLCSAIGLWCNGNTADSGPAFPGSSPGSPTRNHQNKFLTTMDDYHADNYNS